MTERKRDWASEEIALDAALAAELAARLSAEFGVEIPASVFIEHPSVEDLAQYVAQIVEDGGVPHIHEEGTTQREVHALPEGLLFAGSTDSGPARVRRFSVSNRETVCLQQHVVNGRCLMPTDAYLEMLAVAARGELGVTPLHLERLQLAAPLAASDGESRSVAVRLEDFSGSLKITIESEGSGAQEVNAVGLFKPSNASDARTVRHWEVLDNYETRITGAEIYSGEGGSSFGPFYRTIREIRVRGNTAVSVLEPSAAALGEKGAFLLSPPVVDGLLVTALTFARALAGDRSRLFLPVLLEDVSIPVSLPAERVWGLVEVLDSAPDWVTFRASIVNDDNQIVFSCGRLNVSVVNPAAISGEVPSAPASEPEAEPCPKPEAVAVIGMSCRFPGASSAKEFWRNLVSGVDSIERVPKDRWDADLYYDPDPRALNRSYSREGGFLGEIDRFDPLFFNISPDEAELMDPQQRLFLEEAWKALEDAGYSDRGLSGVKCGVFAGASTGDYMHLLGPEIANSAQAFTGLAPSILSARISYFLNLTGPSVAMDTACSSSLLAVRQAVESVLSGDSDMALAGGVSLMLSPDLHIKACKTGMLSPTGRCRSFDRSADGIVLGEGVGVVVLKPLARALADRDHIYGVIRAAGANQDGRTNGITAPSGAAQARLLRDVYARARIEPSSIGLIEAHGTGTALGDPVEIEALLDVFRSGGAKAGSCALGSVKANIGHTTLAAGIASFIKVLLALEHRQVPPQINFSAPAEGYGLEGSPLYVPLKAGPFRSPEPLRAGVSSFGFSGTNVHVVVEDAPAETRCRPRKPSRPAELITVSAKTPDALARRLSDLLAWLEEPDAKAFHLCDVAFTLLQGRSHFKVRAAFAAESLAGLRTQLQEVLQGGRPAGFVTRDLRKDKKAPSPQLLERGRETLERANASHEQWSRKDIRERFVELAELFVQGAGLDWNLLYPAGQYDRIPLPTYPFSRSRYWVQKTKPESRSLQAPSTPTHSFVALSRGGRQENDERAGDEYPRLISGSGGASTEIARCSTAQAYVPDKETTLHEQEISRGYSSPAPWAAQQRNELEWSLQTPGPPGLAASAFPAGQGGFMERVLVRESSPAPGEYHFSLRLSGEEFFLTEHIIGDLRTLPGAALLEIARAAGALACSHPVRSLRNTVWASPVTLAKGAAPVELGVRVRVLPDGSASFEISREKKVLCCKGEFSFGPAEPATVSLENLVRSGTEMTGERFYSTFEGKGLHLGPAFRVLATLRTGDGETLSRVVIPPGRAADFSDFGLHPSLLDGAFQTGIADPSGSGNDLLVPFSVARVELHRPLLPECWVHAVRDATARAGTVSRIEILDTEGNVLVRIEDFLARPARRESVAETILGHSVWKSEPLSRTSGLSGTLLVFAQDSSLLLHLTAAGHRDPAALVTAGSSFCRRGERTWEIDPCRAEDYQRLLSEMRASGLSPAAVLHNWTGSLSASTADGVPLAAASMFLLLKALQQDGSRAPRRVLHVYEPAGVSGAVSAALSGLARAVALETPHVVLTTLAWAGLAPSRMAEVALSELALVSQAGLEARVVNGERQIRHLQELEWTGDPAGAVPLVRGGVTLVTGGAGRLGLALARWVARETAGKLVLCGRSPLSAEVSTVLDELRALGAEAVYRRADVASPDDVTALVAEITSSFGPLTGVFHLAGTTRDRLLDGKSLADFSAVLAPKVPGTVLLDEATREHPLAFFVLFSSIAAALGNRGQSDYSYANRFLDEFALWREARRAEGSRSGHTISLEWPLFDEGALRADAASEKLATASLGVAPLPSEKAWQILAGCLSGTLPSPLLVLNGDPAKVRKLFATPAVVSAPFPSDSAAPEMSEALRLLVEKELVDLVCGLLKLEPGDVVTEEEMSEYGFNSINLTEFTTRVNNRYGVDLTPAVLFEHSTLQALSTHMLIAFPVEVGRHHAVRGGESMAPDSPARTRTPSVTGQETRRQEVSRGADERAVAIVGISGVMPGSEDLAAFWKNLEEERDLISEIPADRWDWRVYAGEAADGANRTNVRWGGFMPGLDLFDPLFFGISPREAELMDPQQRLLLQNVWRAIEDAGERPSSLAGSKMGIFLGVSTSDYGDLLREQSSGIGTHGSTGMAHSVLANRISYFLDVHGPSEPIDTACSSSLVALHRAVEAIRSGACETAIAGGVNALLSPTLFIAFAQAGMLSEDGRCRSFDRSANGYVRGEGVGALFLKPLSAARRDGNPVYAVVRGTALNHGGRASSLTAPNPRAQSQLLVEAFEDAGIDPFTLGYVEAHGTGTPLGDPIEVNSLKQSFSSWLERHGGKRPAGARCGIGTVKSNIGHLEAAAGVAGVLKVLLAMKHRRIPASLHVKEVNPQIRLEGTPFEVVVKMREWEPLRDESGRELPLRAGVSSFGFGGVNVHVVLEALEHPEPPSVLPGHEGPELIVLSAKTPERLSEAAQRLAAFLDPANGRPPRFSEVAFTLQAGREAMEERLAFVAQDLREMVRILMDFSVNPSSHPEILRGRVNTGRRRQGLFDGDEGREFLRIALSGRKLGKLAELWIAGVEIDWYLLHGSPPPSRVSLPGYPFARERYWVPGTPAALLRKELAPAVEPGKDARLYERRWVPQASHGGPVPREVFPLLLLDSGDALRQEIQKETQTSSVVILVKPGTAFTQADLLTFEIDPRSSADFVRLRDALAERGVRPASLVHAWSSLGGALDLVADDGLARSVFPLFDLVSAFGGSARHWVVAGSTPDPFFEAAGGIARSVPGRPSFTWLACRDARRILGELATSVPGTVREVRYEGDVREVRQTAPLNLHGGEQPAFRHGGVYLLTGGLGALGRLVAKHLAGRFGARLALVGRTKAGPASEGAVEEIRALGGEAIYLTADVGDLSQMREAVTRVQHKLGPIQGVLHAAGRLPSVSGLDVRDELLATLRPKVDGVIALDLATREAPLDFFLSFSSISSFLGDMGSGVYAVANRFLDGFTAWREFQRARGNRSGRSVVINWPLWKEGGAARHARYGEAEPAGGILETADGLAVLELVLGSGTQQAIVFSGDAASAPRSQERKEAPATEAPAFVSPDLGSRVERYLTELFAAEFRLAPNAVDVETPLSSYGLDSILLNQITSALSKLVGPLPKTLLLENETVREVAAYLVKNHAAGIAELLGEESSPKQELAASRVAAPAQTPAPVPAKVLLPSLVKNLNEPIAVIGLAGRYPGAPTLEDFWANLISGRSSISEVPTTRWNAREFFDPDPARADDGKIYCRRGAFLADVEMFDALHFGISPAEARSLKPEERLLLELATEALEDAGHHRASLSQQRVAVYIGVTANTFPLAALEHFRSHPEVPLDTSLFSLANRISHHFDLRGPSLAIDTSCSSALVAIHTACESLRTGAADLALAGGVNLILHPSKYQLMCQGRLLSRQDDCELFSKGGDGFLPGEGGGIAVLKPLSRAIADGDNVQGVILASEVSHKGSRAGYRMPSPNAQAELLSRLFESAGVDPASISYVEAQAIGSELADAAEWSALKSAFGPPRNGVSCAVGSLKPNIGHLEAASGIAQLSKVLLMMRHSAIAPCKVARELNPEIELAGSAFTLASREVPWLAGDARRRAVVSSFGVGGVQAALLVEAFERDRTPSEASRPEVIPVSARSEGSLRQRLEDLVSAVERVLRGEGEPVTLADIAHTLYVGREEARVRFAAVVSTLDELLTTLRAHLRGEPAPVFAGRAREGATRAEAPADAHDRDALSRLAEAWVSGSTVDWRALSGGRPARRVSLPPIRFERERCWPDSGDRVASQPAVSASARVLMAAGASPAPTGQTVAAYYGQMANAVRDRVGEEEVHLVFAPFLEPVPGFSWLLTFFEPEKRANHHELMLRAQRELKSVLFASVDFGKVTRVLDIGCGLSTDLIGLARKYPLLTGTGYTITPEQAELGRARIEKAGLSDRLQVFNRDSTKEEFPGLFDAALAFEVLFHIENKAAVLANVSRHLVPGGTLLVADCVANTVTDIQMPHLGQFTSTAPRLAQLFASAGLIVETCVDVGVEMSHFLSDPDFERNLASLHSRNPGAAAGEAEHRGFHNCGKAFAQKLIRYVLLTVRKAGPELSEAELTSMNAGRLARSVSYREALSRVAPAPVPVAATPCVPPDSTGVEQTILAVTASALGVAANRIDPEARFVEIGVDSLVGLRLLDAVNRKLGLELPMEVLYDHSSVRDLARLAARKLQEIPPHPPAPEDEADREKASAPPYSFVAPFRGGRQENDERAGDEYPRLISGSRGASTEITRCSTAQACVPDKETTLHEQEISRGYSSPAPLAAQQRNRLEWMREEAASFAEPHGPAVSPEEVPTGRNLFTGNGQMPIAVIGMAGRFPGAPDVRTFWRNLRNGVDSVTEVPRERWDTTGFYDPDPARPGRSTAKWGGFLDRVDLFDAPFFRITRAEAEVMDPQQRLFLETCWTALEDTGQAPSALGGKRCGVFAGVFNNDYQMLLARAGASTHLGHAMLGNADSILAARISYALDLKGPAMGIDTACSSSLVATHLACRGLQSGEIDMALAGGVTLYLDPAGFVMMSKAGMLSTTGRCRAFDEKADGIVTGEAAGVVVLKRLDDALKDRDQIYGVIRGSGLNQDGRTNGITAPSKDSQKSLLVDVYRRAGIDPATIGFVEAHGTGTRLGDPIEVAALTEAFREFTARERFAALGSVKSNIGHTSAAAGVAGLIKTLLALRHGEIPPTLHVSVPSHFLRLDGSPFFLATELLPWEKVGDTPRRAAVSAFGFSGTNAHLVVEEAPVVPRSPESCGPFVFPLSARNSRSLAERARDLLAFLRSTDDGPLPGLADIAFTLQDGRDVMEEKLAVEASSHEELRDKLARFLGGETAVGVPFPVSGESKPIGRRASLPAYPFARERYWFRSESDSPSRPPNSPESRRWFFEGIRTGGPDGGTQISYELTPETNVLLREHTVFGRQCLPTDGILEMVHGAVREILGTERIRLTQVFLFSQLPGVPGQVTRAELSLSGGNPAEFVLRSRVASAAGPFPKVAAGFFARLAREERGVRSALPETNAEVLDARSLARPDHPLQAGEFYRSLVRLSLWEKRAVGELRLSAAARAVTERFSLHPGLLGGVLGVALALAARRPGEDSAAFIPLSIAEVSVYGELSDSVYRADVRLVHESPEALRFDADLVDSRGNVAVALRGLDERRVSVAELERTSTRPPEPRRAVSSAGPLTASSKVPRLRLKPLETVAERKSAATEPPVEECVPPVDNADITRADVKAVVRKLLGETLLVDPATLHDDRSLIEQGIDSILGLEFVQSLNRKTGLGLPGTVLFENPTIDRLTEFLHRNHSSFFGMARPSPGVPTPLSPVTGEQGKTEPEPARKTRDGLAVPAVERVLIAKLAETLMAKEETLDPRRSLIEQGIDSILGLEFVQCVNRHYDLHLPGTVLFEHPTIERMARHLVETELAVVSAHGESQRLTPEPLIESASSAVLEEQPVPVVARSGDIAVIGMAGRFPGSATLDELWRNLAERRYLIGAVPRDHWDSRPFFRPGSSGNRIYTNRGGFIDGVDQFDPLFFNVSPREADTMDPQLRLFLEVLWECLEDAGHAGRVRGTATGLYLGNCYNDYLDLLKQRTDIDFQFAGSGNSNSMLSNRAAYFYDLRGPCLTLDTACSSSLVALHLACQALRNGECEMAVAGGVNLNLSPSKYLSFCAMGAFSKSGEIRPFDAAADGYLPGEGIAAVLLKPLEKAIRDGDRIQGVIRGSSVRCGGRSAGPTVPNPDEETATLIDAWRSAGVDPETITFLEAHGTGTVLGDPLEWNAIQRAFAAFTKKTGFCAVATVKGTFGHTEATAGLAGVIRVLLQMKHRTITGLPNLTTPNPMLQIDGSAMVLATETRPWTVPAGTPLRAGVSSFGMGGTYAHVVLEEPPQILPESASPSGPETLVLSARTPERLKAVASQLARFLADLPPVERGPSLLRDLAHTLRTGRELMEERLEFTAASIDDVERILTDFVRDPGTAAALVAGLAAGEEGSPGRRGRLLALPTYPFEREHCWLPVPKPSGSPVRRTGSRLLIDGLDLEATARESGGLLFKKTLRDSESFLDHHRVLGEPILPGAAFIEMVLEALQEALPGSYTLWRVLWRQPVAVSESEKPVRLLLRGTAEGYTAELQSADSSCTVHATCEVRPARVLDLPARVAVESLRARLGDSVAGEVLYEKFESADLLYGESFRGLTRLFAVRREGLGRSEALGRLEPPGLSDLDSDAFIVHPALLDSAFQGISALVELSGTARPCLPHAVESVVLHRKPGTSGWVHVETVGEMLFDVTLLDDAGDACVVLKRLLVRELRAPGRPFTQAHAPAVPGLDFLYVPRWVARTAPRAHASGRGPALVVAGPGADASAFVTALAEKLGRDRTRVMRLGDDVDGFGTGLRSLPGDFSEVVFLGGAGPEPGLPADLSVLESGQNRSLWPFFRLVKALLASGYSDRPLDVRAVTNGIHAIREDEQVQPLSAGILGLCRTVSSEYRNWRVSGVDVRTAGVSNFDALAAAVLAEPPLGPGRDVALRPSGRWERVCEPLSIGPLATRQPTGALGAGDDSLLRHRGVYLVAGGMGGLGQALCRHLASRWQARLVLVGRRAPDAHVASVVAELEQVGGRALYVPADVSNPESLREAVQAARKQFGSIHGAVHSAFVLRDSRLATMEEQVLRNVLHPKAQGTMALHWALEGEPLDFLLYFSSVQSFMGNPGQGNYAAASTFEDACVNALRQHVSCPVKLISWGYWGSVGVVATHGYRRQMAALGVSSIEPEEGMAVVEASLTRGAPDHLIAVKGEGRFLRSIGLDAPGVKERYPERFPSLLDSTLSRVMTEGSPDGK